MARTKDTVTETKPVLALRKFANGFPEAEEGTSCVKRAFRARGKAYAYIGMKADEYNVMVKLGDSLAAAAALQAKHPHNYAVGKHGWTTARFAPEEFAPKGLLEGWITESYRLLAHKSLVAQLSD